MNDGPSRPAGRAIRAPVGAPYTLPFLDQS
jgi:hypothetical protein